MIMKLREMSTMLEEMAPPELAEEWDNVGLLAGDERQHVKRVMLTIDLTAEVLAEAKKNRTDLLLAYHPPIWDAIKKVVAGRGASPLLYEAIRAGISIYAMHTALDSVGGGVNDVLAEIVGIEPAEPLQPPKFETGKVCKLIVFVPEGALEKVSEAMFAAGAGQIGEYRKCSFRCRGTGTFLGSESSQPAVGKAGRLEQVEEYRLEAVVTTKILGPVIRALVAAHPYEEVAYDVIPLLDGRAETGLGRIGNLQKAAAIPDLVDKIKKTLKVKSVGLIGPQRGKVKRAAVCAGSCGSLLRHVITGGGQFYLTGELKHHHALELQEAGVTACCVGHSNSERMILPRLAKKLKQKCPEVEIKISRKDHDPIVWD
jgi:dinuclear metal center YbgI/SA1388 family protein